MKKSLLGIIVFQALTVSSISPMSLAKFARVGARVVPADLMKAMAQRGMSADASQLVPVADAQELDFGEEKKYTCDNCLTTSGCRVFKDAKGLYLQQLSGPIGRGEIAEALWTGSLAFFTAPIPLLVSILCVKNGIPYSEIANEKILYSGVLALGIGSPILIARTISVLRNANNGWWASQGQRDMIAYRRLLSPIDLIVDTSNWVALNVKGRENPMSATKIWQAKQCCSRQERIAKMKEELKGQ